MLLDEPTNHLDDDALDLLESFLVGLPGVVVAASHDRVFLDRVCTQIVDLDPTAFGTDGRGGRRHSLGGAGFTDYLARRAEARRRWERTYSRAAARDRRTARRRLDRHQSHRARPGPAGQRQVHPRVQGRQGGTDAGPPGA